MMMKRTSQKKALYTIIFASVFTAIIAVLTFFVKIPSHNGYVHIGDSVIYIASCILPTPFAVFCAAIGGALADTIGGYIIYIVPTLIIKALISLCFDNKGKKIVSKRNIIGLIPASIITILGYYVAEVVLVALSTSRGFSQILSNLFTSVTWISALYCIPGNITQAVASVIVFILFGIALDKIKFKDKI